MTPIVPLYVATHTQQNRMFLYFIKPDLSLIFLENKTYLKNLDSDFDLHRKKRQMDVNLRK